MADNKLELAIAGLYITVCTPEDADYTRELAAQLDKDIRSILAQSDGASVTSSALLCAIDYLNNQKKAKRSADNMRNQIKDYLAEAAAAKLELEDERRRSADLSAEIQTLHTQLTRLAIDNNESGINDRIQNQLTATTNELVTLRSRINELTTLNKSANERNDSLSEMLSQRDEDALHLTQENDALREQLAKSADIIGQQAHSLDDLSAENNANRERADKLAAELAALKDAIMGRAHRAPETASAPQTAPRPAAPEYRAPAAAVEEKTAPAEPAPHEAAPEAEPASVQTAAPAPTPDINEAAQMPATPLAPASRGKAFDYDASLADSEYEQLDVSIIAQVSDTERERKERDEEWMRMHSDEEDIHEGYETRQDREEQPEEQPFVPAVPFDSFERYSIDDADGRAPEDDASITAQFAAFTESAEKEMLGSPDTQTESCGAPLNIPTLPVEAPVEASVDVTAEQPDSVQPSDEPFGEAFEDMFGQPSPEQPAPAADAATDMLEHTVNVDHSIFDDINGSNDLSWTMNI